MFTFIGACALCGCQGGPAKEPVPTGTAGVSRSVGKSERMSVVRVADLLDEVKSGSPARKRQPRGWCLR